jgi:hypothetical protein
MGPSFVIVEVLYERQAQSNGVQVSPYGGEFPKKPQAILLEILVERPEHVGPLVAESWVF